MKWFNAIKWFQYFYGLLKKLFEGMWLNEIVA